MQSSQRAHQNGRARRFAAACASLLATSALSACGNDSSEDVAASGASGPAAAIGQDPGVIPPSLGIGAERPVTPGAPTTTGTTPEAPSLGSGTAPVLYGAPLIFNPTASSFSINVVTRSGDPSLLQAQVRAVGESDYAPLGAPSHPEDIIAQWTAQDLEAGSDYQYAIQDQDGNALFEGQVVTQRPPGEAFDFTIITDSHVPQPVATAQQRDEIEAMYTAVMDDVTANERPDFVVNLGDMLDFHLYGFNAPPARPEGSRDAYMNYRALAGPLLGNSSHFAVIGNWEGENGCFSDAIIDRSLSQRLLYLPGPEPDTYPEGGNGNEDYYAFQWGDALFVVLNVMTYTETCHELSTVGGTPEDWTLGAEQLEWFENTLAEATSKWRFVLIHHVVGGAAGNDANSNYGRGGGQSAYIGEQALVHEMMRQAGVQIFFYGHDHVFTDMVVDGIHYTLPGSAGAPWKFTTSETGYVNYWSDSGYARVHVSPEDVNVDFVGLGGTELYGYALSEEDHVSLNEPPLPPEDLPPIVVMEDQKDAGPSVPADAGGSSPEAGVQPSPPENSDASVSPADGGQVAIDAGE